MLIGRIKRYIKKRKICTHKKSRVSSKICKCKSCKISFKLMYGITSLDQINIDNVFDISHTILYLSDGKKKKKVKLDYKYKLFLLIISYNKDKYIIHKYTPLIFKLLQLYR